MRLHRWDVGREGRKGREKDEEVLDAVLAKDCERLLVGRLRVEPRLTVSRLGELLFEELGVRVGRPAIQEWMRGRGWVGIPRAFRALHRDELLEQIGCPRLPLDGLGRRILVLRVGLGEPPVTQEEAANRLGIPTSALRRAEEAMAGKVRRAVLGLSEGPPAEPAGRSTQKSRRVRYTTRQTTRHTGWSRRFRGFVEEIGADVIRQAVYELRQAGEITELEARIAHGRLGLAGAVWSRPRLVEEAKVSERTVSNAELRVVAKVRQHLGLGEVPQTALGGEHRSRSRLYGELGRAGVQAVIELCNETLAFDTHPDTYPENHPDNKLDGAFVAAGLSRRQREALTRYLGLDGAGPRPSSRVARELGISGGQVQRHRQAALRKLILHVVLREESAPGRKRAARESLGELVDRLYRRASSRVVKDVGSEELLWITGPAEIPDEPRQARGALHECGTDLAGKLVERSIGVLSQTEREIVSRRMGRNRATLASLAEELNLSHEGVRQIELKASGKLLQVLRLAQEAALQKMGRTAEGSKPSQKAGVEV